VPTTLAFRPTPGKLAALPVGARVNVSLRVDGKTVAAIQTQAP
jgi:hypothetical protein